MTTADTVDILDRTFDLDAHEMAPMHFWGKLFGEPGARLAEITEPLMKKAAEGGNDFYNPTVEGDAMEVTPETVWHVRGTSAPSAIDLSRRIEVMDVMGIRRQMVFPSVAMTAFILMGEQDAVLRNVITQMSGLSQDELSRLGRDCIDSYNEFAARLAPIAPDRLRPVAYLPPTSSAAELTEMVRGYIERGIRVINLPAGTPPGGCSPASPDLDPFWGMCAEADLAIVSHLGSEQDFLGSGAWSNAPAFEFVKHAKDELSEPYTFSTHRFAFENFLTCMVLGGVFERHPRLRFGVIEAGAGWFGPLADSLDRWAVAYSARMAKYLSMKPSEYLARNVRVTPYNTLEDAGELLRAHPNLATCYSFSTDYPHQEGGVDSKKTFDDVVAPLGDEIRELFFAGNGSWLLPD